MDIQSFLAGAFLVSVSGCVNTWLMYRRVLRAATSDLAERIIREVEVELEGRPVSPDIRSYAHRRAAELLRAL